MTVTIDDLLNALQNLDQPNKLDNTRETWERIGNKDRFEELDLEGSDLDEFLKEWIDNNPYSNI
jgi:hypothetical protein